MGELMGNMQPTHQSGYGLLAILKREINLTETRTISEEELKSNQELKKWVPYLSDDEREFFIDWVQNSMEITQLWGRRR